MPPENVRANSVQVGDRIIGSRGQFEVLEILPRGYETFQVKVRALDASQRVQWMEIPLDQTLRVDRNRDP